MSLRPSGRAADELREVSFVRGYTQHAEGSVLVGFGATRVLCTASIEEGVPSFLRGAGQGWVTAENGMLPRATLTRTQRDAEKGKVNGRAQEIQRLIGRSLRSVVNLALLGERTVTLDCDVLQADGGTRCAAITGASAALALALGRLTKSGMFKQNPMVQHVAAVSVGILDGAVLLDLCYEEDARAEVDANVVMTADGNLVEVQATAERAAFSRVQMGEMLDVAGVGIGELMAQLGQLPNI